MRKRKLLSLYKDYPLYLWIVGAIPIVHLYSENLGLVFDNEVIPSLILMLLGTTIAFLATNHWVRNRHRTAFYLGVCSIAFSLSGHVYELVFIPKSLGIWTFMVLSALVLILVPVQRIRIKAVFIQTTSVFNLIMFCLLSLQIISLVTGFVDMSNHAEISEAYTTKYSVQDKVTKVNDSLLRPDIYYIIPDGYPSDMWLARAMNYDNSAFTAALKDRGFTVADHAQANYGKTLLSLASTLNMRYYDSNQSPFSDLDFLRLEIANSAVARQLVEQGYTFIQFMSGYLVPSPLAAINRDFTPRGSVDVIVSESDLTGAVYLGNSNEDVHRTQIDLFYKKPFIPLYIDTTILRLARSQLEKLFHRVDGRSLHNKDPERFLATAEAVTPITSLPEATFTIVHLIKPHGPTVFDEHGAILESNYSPNPEEFFAEFKFINSRFLWMIDKILEASQNPPIIIFQADHGSTYGDGSTMDGRSTHFDTYAAYYLPASFSIDLPEPYTLINTFPLILNEVFGTEYELQEDYLFELPVGYDDPFRQIDVTEEFANWR